MYTAELYESDPVNAGHLRNRGAFIKRIRDGKCQYKFENGSKCGLDFASVSPSRKYCDSHMEQVRVERCRKWSKIQREKKKKKE